MDHTQIEEIARAIANHTILDTWEYWAVLLALVFLVSCGAAWLGAYMAKRGEVAAAAADRKKILDQLSATTKVTEEVKSAISFDEWTERERRSLRRIKLEEMVLLAHKGRNWLDSELNRLVYETEQAETASPLPIMMTLAVLYFPEILEAVHNFDLRSDEYRLEMLEIHGKYIQARMDNPGDELAANAVIVQVKEDTRPALLARFQAILAALSAVQFEASTLMASIIAPPA